MERVIKVKKDFRIFEIQWKKKVPCVGESANKFGEVPTNSKLPPPPPPRTTTFHYLIRAPTGFLSCPLLFKRKLVVKNFPKKSQNFSAVNLLKTFPQKLPRQQDFRNKKSGCPGRGEFAVVNGIFWKTYSLWVLSGQIIYLERKKNVSQNMILLWKSRKCYTDDLYNKKKYFFLAFLDSFNVLQKYFENFDENFQNIFGGS